MTRPQDWPALLNGYVEAARSKPFVWGDHDCVTFTCRWHKLMTGRDVYAQFRGRYDSETAAMRVMLANGVNGMDEAGRFLFGEPRNGNLRIGRGDIVYGQGALGICIGAQGAFLNEEGVTLLRHSQFELGWSI